MRRVLLRKGDGTLDTTPDPGSVAEVLRDPRGLLWMDAEGEPVAALEALAGPFELHPVTVEDFVNRNQRPKIEEFDPTSIRARQSTSGTCMTTWFGPSR